MPSTSGARLDISVPSIALLKDSPAESLAEPIELDCVQVRMQMEGGPYFDWRSDLIDQL